MSPEGVPGLVDHLFRHESARLVSRLAAVLGPVHLDLAEEVVQEALVAALQTWPFRGVPDNPAAWLMQVARNRAIDAIRHHRFIDADESALERALAGRLGVAPDDPAHPVIDDELAIVFMTCHPALPAASRVALTLKIAGGLSVAEIARALLSDEPAVAQRIVRAKRQIREAKIALDLPPPEQLGARLVSVLDVLYLLFNEGYAATEGDALVREDLCFEAIRLVRRLLDHPHTGRPECHALAALMLFHAARLPARTGDEGDLLMLEQQDRQRWEWPLVHQAFRHLDRAATGDLMTPYHVQAAIAAAHAAAPAFGDTDWPRICDLYDQLYQLTPTPIVALNRAIATGARFGPEAGLTALDPLAAEPTLARYHLLYGARAKFLRDAGRPAEAAGMYRQSLACRLSNPERRFLQQQLDDML